MYVVVSDDEVEKARKETTDFIEIVKFVDKSRIPPIYFFESHFLVPDGKVGAESFAVFHKAMADMGKAAVGRVVLRNKEHLLSVTPYNGSLIAYSLHYAEEVQNVHNLQELDELKKTEINEKNLKMAEDLIANLSGDFDPDAPDKNISAPWPLLSGKKKTGSIGDEWEAV